MQLRRSWFDGPSGAERSNMNQKLLTPKYVLFPRQEITKDGKKRTIRIQKVYNTTSFEEKGDMNDT